MARDPLTDVLFGRGRPTFELPDLPEYEPPRPNLIGPGRGAPPVVFEHPPLEQAEFYLRRGLDAYQRGEVREAGQDLRTAVEIEATTPVDRARFQHRITTGNRLERAGLEQEAAQYRAHTIRLFDRR